MVAQASPIHSVENSVFWNVFTDLKENVSSIDGIKDSLEAMITVDEWLAHLGHTDGEFSNHLDPIKKTLAFPQLVGALAAMRDRWHVLNHSDDPNAPTDFAQSLALTTFHTSEVALAADAWGIHSFKEGLKAIQTTFWSALGVMEGIEFFKEMNRAQELQGKVEKVKHSQKRELLQSKVQLCYLNVLMHVTVLAMAAIALTSLLFASIAHGILFSPVAFLSLTSTWLALNYITYFYSRVIERQEARIPTGVV